MRRRATEARVQFPTIMTTNLSDDQGRISPARLYFLLNLTNVQEWGRLLDTAPLAEPEQVQTKSIGIIAAGLGIAFALNARDASRRWQIPMLVTMIESYIEDIVTACALERPTLILEADKTPTIEVERVVKSPDLSKLVGELVATWARAFVSKGPRGWLKRFGVWGFRWSEGTDQGLDYLWARRNVVVHNAGNVTPELAESFPDERLVPGLPIRCTSETVIQDTQLAWEFVSLVDRLLIERFGLTV